VPFKVEVILEVAVISDHREFLQVAIDNRQHHLDGLHVASGLTLTQSRCSLYLTGVEYRHDLQHVPQSGYTQGNIAAAINCSRTAERVFDLTGNPMQIHQGFLQRVDDVGSRWLPSAGAMQVVTDAVGASLSQYLFQLRKLVNVVN